MSASDVNGAVAAVNDTAETGSPGEIVPVGKPVLTLYVGSERWFAFTLREDALATLTVGSDVTLTTDDGRRIAAKVTELRPLGEFATWRAARAVGDHDLNSFRLRLDPVEAKDDGLQPGMTVWRFDRVGRPTHHVEPQGECFVTNVAFGGPAGTSLFMTDSGHGQILKAEMPVAGKPMFSHA